MMNSWYIRRIDSEVAKMNPLLIRGTESDFMVNTRERESDFIENY